MSTHNFLCDRLVIRGELLVSYALHIGSGETSRRSDAPIRRDAQGRPYIPGSSLAGVLRSIAQDFAPYFFTDSKAGIDCLFGKGGKQSTVSRVIVEDAFLATPLPAEVEVRKHVGIDRRKGAARSRLKYDREVTPGNTRYRCEISVEQPEDAEARLLRSILDFWTEFGFYLGGRTTSGLGEARLDGDSLTFYCLDFSRPEVLREYLCCGDPQDPIEYLPPGSQVSRESLPPPIPKCTPSDAELDAEAFRPQHLFLAITLIPEEPLLVQAPVPHIPDPAATAVGAGRTSDADFVTALSAPTDANGNLSEQPYVPGSSLKGVLRTRAEKIIRTLTFYREQPNTETDQGYRSAQEHYKKHLCACAITHDDEDSKFPEPDRFLACFGSPKKQREAQKKAKELDQRKEGLFARELYDKSCPICRLFGNTMMQGRLHVGDATLTATTVPQPKLFDHVAIDRFHGGAEDKQKFDTRPLMPMMNTTTDANQLPTFRPMLSVRLHLERFEPWMLGLIGHLLKDLHTADLRLGHAAHRGYGRIRGVVTKSELFVLPGSELESLCASHGVLSTDAEQRQRFGPYWWVTLGLPQFFGEQPWSPQGLQGEILETPIAKLLIACDGKFTTQVRLDEGREHGHF